MDRETTIQSLANSMGIINIKESRFGDSRYDKGTGTLYTNGYVISKGILQKAINYFTQHEEMCKQQEGPEYQELMMIYAAGAFAIKQLQDDDGNSERLKKILESNC